MGEGAVSRRGRVVVEKLKEARAFSEKIGSGAVMIVFGGRILDEWGETQDASNAIP